MKDGGSVDIKFKAQAVPQADDVAYLFERLGHNLTVTLEPPSPERQAELKAQEED